MPVNTVTSVPSSGSKRPTTTKGTALEEEEEEVYYGEEFSDDASTNSIENYKDNAGSSSSNKHHNDHEAQQRKSLANIYESAVRVTLAGFGGSLVGLALQQQRQQRPPVPPTTTSPVLRPALPTTPRGGLPMVVGTGGTRLSRPTLIHPTMTTSLSTTWAISCMMFVLTLESSRLVSPGTILWNAGQRSISSNDDHNNSNNNNSSTMTNGNGSNPDTDFVANMMLRHPTSIRTQSMITVFDYAMGGMVAGLSGAWAQQRRRIPPPSGGGGSGLGLGMAVAAAKATTTISIRWGMGMGLTLGVLAGVGQATIDALDHYLEQHYLGRQTLPAASSSSVTGGSSGEDISSDQR